MTLFASFFVLFFVVFVVCGILVNAYLYVNGAFYEEKSRRRREPFLRSASFSQTATMPTPTSASDLYYGGIGVQNEDRASFYVRRFILIILAILAILVLLVILTVLMPGTTQF